MTVEARAALSKLRKGLRDDLRVVLHGQQDQRTIGHGEALRHVITCIDVMLSIDGAGKRKRAGVTDQTRATGDVDAE